MQSNEILALEKRAYNAWQAAAVQDLDGWKLRYTYGVTGRGNSAWPNHHAGQIPLEEKIEAVEKFYRKHDLPPRFMLTEIAQPHGLADILRTRGYQPHLPVAVQTANSNDITQKHTVSTVLNLNNAPHWNDNWASCYQQHVPKTSHEAEVRAEIIQRITTPTTFVTALSPQGEPLGVSLGVLDNGWTGIFCMVTAPQARRQGIATAILHNIAEWSARHNAQLYLQVSTENSAGMLLYTKLGFTTVYHYHHYILQD